MISPLGFSNSLLILSFFRQELRFLLTYYVTELRLEKERLWSDYMFHLDKCTVRNVQDQDIPGLITMSKTIWEGHDYIPTILDKWIPDGHFFVAEYNCKIVGCVKLSMFPDNTLWFEGLRVHQRYQGKGIGKLLNEFAFNYANTLKRLNPLLSFEFCTYYLNHESLHMAKVAGFKPVKKYFVFEKRGVRKLLEPTMVQDFDISLFKQHKDYIPCGWQAIHNSPDSIDWIKSKCTIFQTPQGIYLFGGLSQKNILFLQEPKYDIRKELPYFQYMYGASKNVEIIIASKWKKHLDRIQALGFKDWEGPLTKPNMLVLKK